jgi:hypothetical protein
MSAISGHIYRLRSSAYPFAESEKLLQLVARFPKMFRVEDEGKYAGLRRMPVDRWILFYGHLPEDEAVMVQFIVVAASYRD